MERLAKHEAFEMEVLQWLRSRGLLSPLVFGGGTMLRLCHEMPRYSIDMDFWFYKEVEYKSFYHQHSLPYSIFNLLPLTYMLPVAGYILHAF